MILVTLAHALVTAIAVVGVGIASGGVLWAMSRAFIPRALTEENIEHLRQTMDGRGSFRLTKVIDDTERSLHLSGLLSKLELGRERILERDQRIGDDAFDTTIFWQVYDNSTLSDERNSDFLSRLSSTTREQLRAVVEKGVRINFGNLVIPLEYPRTVLETEADTAAFFNAIADVSVALAAPQRPDKAAIVSRLTQLVLTDPIMGFRRTCFGVLFALLEPTPAEQRSLLRRVLTEDERTHITETTAIEALNDVPHVRALAAAYWLSLNGTQAAMQPLAYAMNAPDAPPSLTAATSKALARLELVHGRITTGTVSVVEPLSSGNLSVHHQAGVLSDAEPTKPRERARTPNAT